MCNQLIFYLHLSSSEQDVSSVLSTPENESFAGEQSRSSNEAVDELESTERYVQQENTLLDKASTVIFVQPGYLEQVWFYCSYLNQE